MDRGILLIVRSDTAQMKVARTNKEKRWSATDHEMGSKLLLSRVQLSTAYLENNI